MTDVAANNKRIAKNTLMLYFRMLLIMAVSLYTSRVVLNTLGIADYGIYNVVGGVIAILSFLNSSLSGAGSRFMTFALGQGDLMKQKEVFSTVLCIHYILAGIVLIVGETAGLWFVYNKLIIPDTRMTAALWVYHCSIITTIISIVSAPYNSLIIAHEKMSAFAYISIVEVILKLIIVFVLVYFPYDKLIVYSILIMIIQIIIRFIYNVYCRKYFHESRVKIAWHPKLFKEIASYSGWTINGTLAIVGYTQGINILLNMFFGPVVNAARGIAVQVQSAVITFVNNFQTAVNPQIIKSYAVHDLGYMHELITKSSKIGFYLVILLSFPVMLCIQPILKIWLGVVPDHTNTFVIIMLLACMLEPIKLGLINAIHATGDIKKFQIYEGSSLLTVVPIAYLLLKLFDISPEAVLCVYLCVEIFTQLIRIRIVLPKICMTFIYYFTNVLKPVLIMLPFVVFPLLLGKYITEDTMLFHTIMYMAIAFVYIGLCIFVIGLNQQERLLLIAFVRKKIKH